LFGKEGTNEPAGKSTALQLRIDEMELTRSPAVEQNQDVLLLDL
jgi:hypothetical protein